MIHVDFTNKSQEPKNTRSLVVTVAKTITSISDIALFIIGSLGIAGILPGSTVGYSVLGLSPLMILGLAIRNFANWSKKKLFTTAVIAFLVCMVIGGLGITGLINGVQLGWIIVGPFIGLIGLGVIGCCCICACKGIRQQELDNRTIRLYS